MYWTHLDENENIFNICKEFIDTDSGEHVLMVHILCYYGSVVESYSISNADESDVLLKRE